MTSFMSGRPRGRDVQSFLAEDFDNQEVTAIETDENAAPSKNHGGGCMTRPKPTACRTNSSAWKIPRLWTKGNARGV